jgi:hypothetical protein
MTSPPKSARAGFGLAVAGVILIALCARGGRGAARKIAIQSEAVSL